MKNLSIPRDKVVLASKVYFNDGCLSKQAILREIDGTLQRLGTDYLDLYQIHRFDYGTPIEETMEALDSLVNREDERELIPVAKQYGVSLIPYSSLAGGHLSHRGWESGTKRSDIDRTLRFKYDGAKENDLVIIDRVAEVAERNNVSMTEIALSWLLKKGVTAPIVGAVSGNVKKTW